MLVRLRVCVWVGEKIERKKIVKHKLQLAWATIWPLSLSLSLPNQPDFTTHSWLDFFFFFFFFILESERERSLILHHIWLLIVVWCIHACNNHLKWFRQHQQQHWNTKNKPKVFWLGTHCSNMIFFSLKNLYSKIGNIFHASKIEEILNKA